MRDDELQQDLRPVRAVDLGGPRWQWVARDRADQVSLAERPVDNDTDPALARQRQNPQLDFAIEHVIGDLHEIQWLARHDLLELAVAPAL